MPDISANFYGFLPGFVLGPFLLVLALAGCTTSAWMIQEDPVPDPDSERILTQMHFFHPVETPTPQNPVLSLELLNERALFYNMHMVSSRHIQQYRPRYGYLALGLTGMGLGLYLSNTSVIDADKLSTRERAMLNLTAVSIGAASYLTMKPTGEARPAGEQRLLQKTGSQVFQDTIPVSIPDQSEAILSIYRGSDSLVNDRRIPFETNTVSIHLADETGLRKLPGKDTTGIRIRLEYRNVSFERDYPLSDFMQEFVEITSSSEPLRTSPVTIGTNIIRHVGRESRFPYLSEVDENWYRILKTDGPAYIRKEHSERIWHIIDTTRIADLVLQPDHTVFGDLEIERNLPDFSRANPDGIAIVIINGEYRHPVQNLPHAIRTGQLVSLYLNQALGYYADNIRVYDNMTFREMEKLLQESDSLMIGGRYLSIDESDVFVYYYGHAFTGVDEQLFLLPVDYDPGETIERLIPVENLVHALTGLRSRQLVLVMDADWTRASVFGHTRDPDVRLRAAGLENLESLMSNLPGNGNAAVFWAAQPGQRAKPYTANNGRLGYPYDIFTWYFFKGLKEGAQTTGVLDRYLERNVPFTSRRLQDRAQDPGFTGNRNLLLVPEEFGGESSSEE